MQITNEVTITQGGISYSLRRGFLDLDGNGTYSKKPVYELTQTSSDHGATRNDMVALLSLKFGLDRSTSLHIVDRLDNAAAEETTTRRVVTDAPFIDGGGIPTKPLALRK